MTDQPTGANSADTNSQDPVKTSQADSSPGVEAAVPADHVLTFQTEVVAGGASTRWEATGEAWGIEMATGGLASLMLTIDEVAAAFAGALNVPQAVILKKVGEKVMAAKAAQAAAAAPKVEIAPPGFDPRRLRLVRDGEAPRRHPPGV